MCAGAPTGDRADMQTHRHTGAPRAAHTGARTHLRRRHRDASRDGHAWGHSICMRRTDTVPAPSCVWRAGQHAYARAPRITGRARCVGVAPYQAGDGARRVGARGRVLRGLLGMAGCGGGKEHIVYSCSSLEPLAGLAPSTPKLPRALDSMIFARSRHMGSENYESEFFEFSVSGNLVVLIGFLGCCCFEVVSFSWLVLRIVSSVLRL